MRYKVTFLVGVGVGYVLGARAGRDRYESIARAARGFADTPAVQEAAGVLQARAAFLARQAKDKVSESVSATVSGTVSQATDTVRHLSPGVGTDRARTADKAFPPA